MTKLVGDLDEAEKVCEDFERGNPDFSKQHHERYVQSCDKFSKICHEFMKNSEFMIESVRTKASSMEIIDKPLAT